jgi:hypothetical protein
MLPRVFVTAIILAGAVTLARADVYRWVDDAGQPHYSDQWVPGSEVIKTVKARPPGADATARTAGQKTLTAASNRASADVSDQDNARAVQQDIARTREAQCKAAKDRYMQAIESRRVYKEGGDGERQYMTDADAAAYREMARKAVQDRCGSVPQFDPNKPIPEPQPIEVKPIPEPKVKPAEATYP